ncbi:MAG: 6-bladed beta-propeller [Candidatus Sabulitectum sp.]|nr:6-bladed beta-propeller [Candidatus Sabulitectum sp.]
MKKTALTLTAIFIACGTPEQQADDSVTADSTEPAHYTITAVDTIGVEFGDSNYVFGQTDAALFGPNNEILVLDGSRNHIALFSADGEFLRSIGRQGSGPGEFLRPMAIALLGNGQLAVSDPWASKISLFDSSYTFNGEITGFFPAPPLAIEGSDGEAIIGLMRIIDIDNGMIGFSLARLNGTAEPTHIYAEDMIEFEPTMIGPGYTESTVAFASDPTGRVCTSIMSTDTYRIECFLPDGKQFLVIEQPFEEVPKTALEIEEEIEDYNTVLERRAAAGGGQRMQSMGIQMPSENINYEPIPYHYAISDLMLDTQERLWVRRGYESIPHFDVYDLDGKLLFTASVEEGDPDSRDWTIVAGDDRLLAFSDDPAGYPKIVILAVE